MRKEIENCNGKCVLRIFYEIRNFTVIENKIIFAQNVSMWCFDRFQLCRCYDLFINYSIKLLFKKIFFDFVIFWRLVFCCLGREFFLSYDFIIISILLFIIFICCIFLILVQFAVFFVQCRWLEEKFNFWKYIFF